MDIEIQKILERLSKDGSWGGAESFKAIQLLHNCNILIINESGDSYFATTYNDILNEILILAFTLKGDVTSMENNNISNEYRDHFESVVHIEPNDVFNISEESTEKIKKTFINTTLIVDECIDLSDSI